MKKYRLSRKYFRDNDNGKVKHYYIVQYLGKTIFGNYRWKDYSYTSDSFYGSYWNIPTFDTLAMAEKYLSNLRESVIDDEIV